MKSLVGRWRITEMELWDIVDIELVGPGFFEFAADQTGRLSFIAVAGWMDCRAAAKEGRPGVEFTWQGFDDGTEVSGRGWAALTDDGGLEGRLWFHLGDDSGFRAEPDEGIDR